MNIRIEGEDFVATKWIYWPHQCDLCSKSWTTDYCEKNKMFMEKLKNMNNEYYGTLDFKCDYFTLDEEKLKKNNFYNDLNCCE